MKSPSINFQVHNQKSDLVIFKKFDFPISFALKFKRIPFIEFFVQNNLDLPPIFLKSKSLSRINGLFWFIKYNSLLTKRGFKEKLLKSSSLFFFLNNFINKIDIPLHFPLIMNTGKNITTNSTDFIFNEKDLLIDKKKKSISIISEQAKQRIRNLISSSSLPLTDLVLNFQDRDLTIAELSLINQDIKIYPKEADSPWDLAQYVNPLFDFFIYKTPKLIWKYSRGKVGKFFVVWKFIPQFKRTNRVLRWISNFIKFDSNFKISKKIQTIVTVDNTKLINLILSRKKFAHNYIFREAKFSSMRSFKPLK